MTENRYPLLGVEQGMILVVARLYGLKVTRDLIMLLDTGSSLTTITFEAAQRLGLDPAMPAGRHKTYVWGGEARVPTLLVPRVRVFGREVRNLEVGVGELPPQLGLDGVLGLNFLQHFDLRINFRQEYIELK